MADQFPTELVGVRDGSVPRLRADGAVQNGGPRRFRASLTLAASGNGRMTVAGADALLIGQLPVGYAPAFYVLNGVALGASAQVAIGTSKVHASNGQYRASAIKNVATMEIGMVVAAQAAAPVMVPTDMWMTVGTADLPTSGQLVVEVWASAAN
jgi:hypothetical protein